MKCFKCKRDFEERLIQESHDVPCYLFEGNRKGQKNQADKWGRHWLCQECHEEYENLLRLHLRDIALNFAKEYFKEDKKSGEDRNTG